MILNIFQRHRTLESLCDKELEALRGYLFPDLLAEKQMYTVEHLLHLYEVGTEERTIQNR